MNLTSALPKRLGRYRNISIKWAHVLKGESPKTIWVIAPPKSGSTWLSLLLARTLKWRIIWFLKPGIIRAEQDVYLPEQFRNNTTENVFSPHTHTKFNEYTDRAIKEYGIQTIILTRNLYDTCVSICDHITLDDVTLPVSWLPASVRQLSNEDLKSLVIRVCLPWYASFYASWAYCELDSVHFVRYEDLVAHPLSCLTATLTKLGVRRHISTLRTALKKATPNLTRFNQGQIGRGMTELTTVERQHIDTLITSYKDEKITSLLKWVHTETTATPGPISTSGVSSGGNDNTGGSVGIRTDSNPGRPRTRTSNKKRTSRRLSVDTSSDNITPGSVSTGGAVLTSSP